VIEKVGKSKSRKVEKSGSREVGKSEVRGAAAYHSGVTCRSCGSEIAEKAIVCYRCGTPTAVQAPRAATPAGSRPWVLVVAAIVMIVLTVVAARLWPDYRTVASVAGGLLAVSLAALAVARWPAR
jgi:putative exporter of polyketide antibiotics